jgi:hypothetical protein
MAQSVILASGQTSARSSTVTIAAGSQATFAIRGVNGAIPNNIVLPIQLALQGGAYRTVGSLMSTNQQESIAAAGVYSVNRDDISAYGINIEVTADT